MRPPPPPSPLSPVPPPEPDPSAPAVPKTWTVGTLVYTSSGITALFAWLIWGDFAWGMRDRSVGPMAQWYLNSLKVPNFLFGLLLTSFPSAVAVILGPIVSVKSDRLRSKWGRRIPYLIITTPLAALGMIGLAWTPVFAHWMHGFFGSPGVVATLHGAGEAGVWLAGVLQNEMIVSVICFGIFWAFFEFAAIIGGSVFGGLINDVVPKPLLGRFFGLFRAVSLIDGIIFNFWLIGKVPEHFTLILSIIGIFFGIAFTWVCFKVKEGDYPPPPATEVKASSALGGFFREAKTYFRECFTSPYYLALFAMFMAGTLCFSPVNTFAIPYARSLGVGMDSYGKLLALTYAISLSLSFFLGWLVDLFHPLRMALIALVVYLAVTICGAMFATTQATFLTLWVIHGVMSGSYMTVSASLGQQLYPHLKFAQFASAGGLMLSFANIVLAPLVGLIIDRSGGVYRYTFVIGAVFTSLALVLGVYVFRKFMQFGGPRGYVAPEI